MEKNTRNLQFKCQQTLKIYKFIKDPKYQTFENMLQQYGP